MGRKIAIIVDEDDLVHWANGIHGVAADAFEAARQNSNSERYAASLYWDASSSAVISRNFIKLQELDFSVVCFNPEDVRLDAINKHSQKPLRTVLDYGVS